MTLVSQTRHLAIPLVGCACLAWGVSARTPTATADTYELNDSHVHLTNYVQEGADIHDFVNNVIGTKVGRAVLFGIPLQ